MKYFIIAGEQSGDLHGSNLIRGLYSSDNDAEIVCWGGDLMESTGAKLLMHYRRLAFMGFVTVLKNLGTIKKNMDLCKRQIKEFNPDVIIFIDYPGFNLRIAAFARNNGFRTFYYISPKLWAWNEKRVRKVRDFIDRMFIIFPFEVDFYAKHGIKVKYAGNPVVDEIERINATLSSSGSSDIIGNDPRPVIALLAGSRKHEVEHVLPQMLTTVSHFPDYQFIVAGVKNIPDSLYSAVIGNKPVRVIRERTYEILKLSAAALVTSGTATLETALIGTPQVVCYRADMLNMLIARAVIKVKFISLVNLNLGYEAVKELIQYNLNEKNLKEELGAILPGGAKRETMLSDYARLRTLLGQPGASSRIASEMVDELKKAITAE